MKKIIVTCRKCKKKMKILNKRARYRCPHCNDIYKFTWYKKWYKSFIGFFVGIFTTIRDIKNNIITKFKNIKKTYSYLRQLQKNNPNWREQLKNYRKR